MVRFVLPLCLVVVVACARPAAQQSATQTDIVANATTAEPTASPQPSPTFVPTEVPTATTEPTVTPSSTPEPTATIAPSATPQPTVTSASLAGGAQPKPTAAPALPTTVPVQASPTTISAPVAPTATAASASAPVEGERFRAVATPDGFVAVREDPNTSSPIVRSLTAGATVVCTGITNGEALTYNGRRSNQWYFCPEVSGFIFELLLEPAGTSQPSTPASPPVVQYVDNTYRVVQTPDGFVALRAQPNTTSATVRTLAPGTIIRCTQIVKGELLTYNELRTNQWLWCPDEGGYVFGALLVTSENTSAVVEPYVVP